MVTTAADAKIINNSAGPVVVSSVAVTPQNGWSIIDPSTDFTNSQVGLKQFGLTLNNDPVSTDGSVTLTPGSWPTIPGSGEVDLAYTTNIAPQDTAIVQEIATVTFIVGWEQAEITPPEPVEPEVPVEPYNAPESWFDISKGGVKLNSTGKAGLIDHPDIAIPATVNGETVTAVGTRAFFSCDSITSVVIPNTVTKIGGYAFQGCTSLTSVDIPNTVTSISSYAFKGCTSLTSVTIPDGVTSISTHVFYNCTSLTSVNIPNSVTSISQSAFGNCPSITKITVDSSNPNYSSDSHGVLFNKDKTVLLRAPGAIPGSYDIPNTVTSIDSSAFQSCTSLTGITIPNTVTEIGTGVFEGCTSITKINVDSSNLNYSSDSYGVLFNKDKTTLVEAPGGISGNYAIPDTVKTIGQYAFCGRTLLTSVDIPSSVTAIDATAFRDCSSLTSVIMSNGVASIGNYAFHRCTALTSINIPDSVTTIGTWAFYDCTSIASITIPDSVTTIGILAFEDVPHIAYTGQATGSPWGALSIN